MHWSALLVVVGLEHTLWVIINGLELIYTLKTIVDSQLRDESSTPSLNSPGPWLV